MDRLLKVANNAAALDAGRIFRDIVANPDLQKKILDLNRLGQLYEKGIDATGRSLKDIGGNWQTDSGYSPFTIMIKEAKGQRTDHITLRDTGSFYESFYIVIGQDEFLIQADPIKDDGTNLITEWGADILGLTDESKQILSDYIREAIVPLVLEFLLAA